MKKKMVGWIIAVVVVLILILIPALSRQKQPQEIKIGAILPLTGQAASFGQYVKEGIDLALQEIGNGKLHITYEDSKGQPQQAVTAYQKLISAEKVNIVVAALSSVASALSPLAEKTDTIQIYVDVVKPDVTDGKYKFRFYPEATQTAGFLALFAYDKLSARTSAILMINDDYGQASYSTFKQRFENLGGKVIWNESYEVNQSEFKNIIFKLKNLKQKPDVIYVNGYGPAFVNAIKTLRTFISDIKIVADVALGVPGNLSQIKEQAEGAYFVDGKMSPEFINLFKSHYGKSPTSDAGYAYTVIKIISEITKKYGTGTEQIRNGLKNLRNYPSVMGNITVKEDGNTNLEFVIMQVRDGIPTLVEFDAEKKIK